MKKNLLLLGLAVAAMTSCTNDEVVDMKQPTQHAIGFEGFVNKGTRAIGSVDNELTNFWVLAKYGTAVNSLIDLYDGAEKVSKNGSVWESATTKYWTDNAYYFIAYADANSSGSAPDYVSITAGGALQITDLELNYSLTDEANNDATLYPSVCNQKDIVADAVQIQGTMNYAEKVPFTFTHLLSKIKFTVVNNGDFPMSITALKVSGINNKGSINLTHSTEFTTPVWTLPVDESKEIITIYPIAATQENMEEDAIVSSVEFLVLPQELTDVKVEILAKFYNETDVVDQKDFTGNDALTISVGEYTNWLPGYFYNYTISLPAAGTKIEFDVDDVTDWTPAAGKGENGNLNTIELNSNQQ